VSGEIDTQGRITAVGGLDIKLETAIGAGCKTVIVPHENLHGPDGIEDFPEALKKELQILTFDHWKGGHEPFDYTRHVLQVVAVDHIVEAQEVAYVDAAELSAVEDQIVERAREAAAQIAERETDSRGCCLVIVTKHPRELDLEMLRPLLGAQVAMCWLLVPPERLEVFESALPDPGDFLRLRVFDLKTEELPAAVHEIVATHPLEACPDELVLVAPFFVLKRAGFGDGVDGSLAKLGLRRLFANNYARQKVKVKGCKSNLTAAYLRLALLGAGALARCPFVTRHEGFHVVDLNPIPEKYRLDLERAKTLLCRWLERWLDVVDENLGRDG
jgi:ATP-dependent Lon protease